MEERINLLQAAGMVFDDPPGPEVIDRINALSDADFAALLAITPLLSTPGSGPMLNFMNGGGFQFRTGGTE